MQSHTPSADDQEADQALRDARSRFIAGFTQRHAAMGTLLTTYSVDLDQSRLMSLRGAAHKLAGLAGVLGFPTVSEHASALEVMLLADVVDPEAANRALGSMGAGFAHDLAGSAPSWAQDARPDAAGARILIVEDDQEQRRLAASGLRSAGYRVLTASDGAEGVSTARAEHPDLILLDIDLPGMDGMAVCRQLKLDPALSSIPVIFCTARTGVIDRMAGLTLGADDYVNKPFAPSELLLRIRHLLSRAPNSTADVAPPSTRALPYDLFAVSATDLLSRGPVAITLARIASADVERVIARLMDDLRRRDVVGQFSEGHLIVAMPGVSADTAKATVRGLLDTMTPPVQAAAIGAADSQDGSPGGAVALDALIAHADLALAQDRVAQSGVDSGKKTVLLAEDDPDVLHIIDTRLRAAGYRTVLALDGQQTLDALAAMTPAVIILDLMMPKLTGFDVLMRLRERAQRPRTIVVSARGRDEDVTRAFELGADDYVSKPFNPEELLARIARLTR
jgi:DNA-binding response OmpR family regulator